MTNIVYCIFSGEYSSRTEHGYLKEQADAEKYCALKNRSIRKGLNEYYFEELYDLTGCLEFGNVDFTTIGNWEYYTVIFDLETGKMTTERPYKYEGLKKDDLYEYHIPNPNAPFYHTSYISFSFNCESKELAVKIAQDKYAEFLSLYHETDSYEDAAKAIGARTQKEVFEEFSKEHLGIY